MTFYRDAEVRIRLRGKDNKILPEPVIRLTNLRVSFSISKSLSWSTNSATIKIWNLSQKNRNLIKDWGIEVTLLAGYRSVKGSPSGVQLLFFGYTTTVSHVFEQPEIVTVLECGDGERVLNESRVSVNFGENARARDIIQEVANQMTLPIVEPSPISILPDTVYRQGYARTSMAKDVLAELCDKIDYQASIQNNQIQIIPKNGSISQPAIVINEQTGMQGIPTRFTYKGVDLLRPINEPLTASPTAPSVPPSRPIGYRVDVALNPQILPGSKVQIESTHLDFNSLYVVQNVRHEGDTFGFVWTSGLEVVAL